MLVVFVIGLLALCGWFAIGTLFSRARRHPHLVLPPRAAAPPVAPPQRAIIVENAEPAAPAPVVALAPAWMWRPLDVGQPRTPQSRS